MTKEELEQHMNLDKEIKNNPLLIERFKQVAWFAVQYAAKLKNTNNKGIVIKSEIDDFIEFELGLK